MCHPCTFSPCPPFSVLRVCTETAHVLCCLPGQDRQVMLDSDDLGYDSMDGEEEDYDDVLEMDSLEQSAVDGELPCTRLALRAKLLGETMELPQVLLGWCLHPAGQWVPVPSVWGDLGFPAPSLVLGRVAPSLSLCCPHHADFVLYPPHQSCHQQ